MSVLLSFTAVAQDYLTTDHGLLLDQHLTMFSTSIAFQYKTRPAEACSDFRQRHMFLCRIQEERSIYSHKDVLSFFGGFSWVRSHAR
jgi:hypothetical protein